MTNQIDDKDDDLLTNVVEPDENEWKRFVNEMKYVRALEYVLQNAPIRAKDPEKKKKASQMALSTMMKIKPSEISDAVNSIPAPLRDTLMKYIYKGFENSKDYSSSALLTWHEKMTSVENSTNEVIVNGSIEETEDEPYSENVHIMKTNNQLRELHTLLRDGTTNRSDFKFYADRLIRLTVEAALDQLPYVSCEVITPTGHSFEGLRHEKGTLCVSLMRSGEVMEKGIRECCRSIRIGKILINEGHVIYAKLPADVHRRRTLVTYPVISTGSTVLTGLEVLLKDYQCIQSNIILITLFSTPDAIKQICERYPDIKIVVSEINKVAPNHFAQKYFGTE